MVQPRLCTLKEQEPLQASKWLQLQLLIDTQEMADLITTLGEFSIFITGAILPSGQGEVTHQEFLATYQKYIDELKTGQAPSEALYRQMFSTLFTMSMDTVYALDIGNDQVIIRSRLPVVQLQMHQVGFSAVDHKFRSMVFGSDNISWGIQFSYPQIFLDPVTKQITNVDKSDLFPNSHLYHTIQKWMRRNTTPTPFTFQNTKVNVPIRIGKSCFEWIQQHPHLAKHGLTVKR